FRPATLAAKVRAVLDQPPAGGGFPASPAEKAAAEDVETPPLRILLVDDHAILRAGIRKHLRQLPGVEIVGEAGDGREALALVAMHQPNIVFMDIAMSGLNGLEATTRLSKEFPD